VVLLYGRAGRLTALFGGFRLRQHTKLSGFGQISVDITPPHEVAEVDMTRML
jgi:hypothetical protein